MEIFYLFIDVKRSAAKSSTATNDAGATRNAQTRRTAEASTGQLTLSFTGK